ncbi:MAG TPA: hypothetical protein VGM53_21965 [Streptosporangiaceae bacterium]|jgi:hypothetical protein
MADTEWAERHWPGTPVRILDHATARALVPDATDEGHEDRDAWLFHTTGGAVAAVAKTLGSVHETRQSFTSLSEAAVSFRAYWPSGLAAEHQAGVDLMDYFARKRGEAVALNYQPDDS